MNPSLLYSYLTIKTLHIVAVISWMAGLLYLYRLFVYHRAEKEPVVRERLAVMQRRLWRAIAVPAAWTAIITGGLLIAIRGCELWLQSWLALKLLAVAGLLVMHALAAYWRIQLIQEKPTPSSRTFRILNEVPTLLMIIIVALVVFQPQWGFWLQCTK